MSKFLTVVFMLGMAITWIVFKETAAAAAWTVGAIIVGRMDT